MEAETLPNKKKLHKGKLKKAMKYVICRPDPIYWPVLSQEHGKQLELALGEYKIDTPVFKKLHWNELKCIPKETRPKPPPIKIVDGFIFGTAATKAALKNCQCSAVIIEALVNPRAIVQPVIEECINTRTPIVCLTNLKKICFQYFRIPTSCLAIKTDSLHNLKNIILEISQFYKNDLQLESEDKHINVDVEMKVCSQEEKPVKPVNSVEIYPYLYRTNKTSRVFVPDEVITQKRMEFSGQDYINFTDKKKQESTNYMRMIVKRITSNPNRAKNKRKIDM